MRIVKNAVELSSVSMVRIFGSCLLDASERDIFLNILFAFVFVSSTAFITVYATSNLEPGNNTNSSRQQLLAEFENMSRLGCINDSDNCNAPLVGSLQLPYGGLLTKSMSPAIAEILDLNSTTRGKIVTHIIPGSPAERISLQALNMARSANLGEVIPSGGDIILAIDGGTTFATDYDNLEQYIYENRSVGENMTLTILRGGQVKDIEMTIVEMPRFLWYENLDEGLKMKYPSDWKVSESGLSKYDIVNFFSPESIAINNSTMPAAHVFVKIIPSNIGLDVLASAEQEDTANTRHLDMFLTSVSNLPAYETVFYDYSDNDRTLKILSAFTIKDGQIYRINFATEPPRYDDYLPLAREMIKSFQFIGLNT